MRLKQRWDELMKRIQEKEIPVEIKRYDHDGFDVLNIPPDEPDIRLLFKWAPFIILIPSGKFYKNTNYEGAKIFNGILDRGTVKQQAKYRDIVEWLEVEMKNPQFKVTTDSPLSSVTRTPSGSSGLLSERGLIIPANTASGGKLASSRVVEKSPHNRGKSEKGGSDTDRYKFKIISREEN